MRAARRARARGGRRRREATARVSECRIAALDAKVSAGTAVMPQPRRRLAALSRHFVTTERGGKVPAASVAHDGVGTAGCAVTLPEPPSMALPSGVEPWPSDWMPVPSYCHVPRFCLSEFLAPRGAAFEHLEAEGYVVLKSMLQESECQHVLSLMWTELEQRGTGIVRGCPETWGGDNARWFGNQWGHSDAKWWVRGQPQFKRVWQRIHGTDDLIVSFDGSVMWRPWGHNKEWRGTAQPLHTDGKDYASGIPNGIPDGYTQGLVNLVKTTPEAGGNALVPRSHLFPPAEFGRDPATHKDGKPTRPAVIEHICAAAKADPGVIRSVVISHLEPGD